MNSSVWPEFGAHQRSFQAAIENGEQFTADSSSLVVHIILASIVSVISGFLAAVVAGENKRAALILGCLLVGLGLPHVDAKAAQSLVRTFKNLDDLAHAPRTRLLAVTDEMMADGIAEWFSDSRHRNLLKRLRQTGLKLD